MKTKIYAFKGYNANKVYGSMESNSMIAVCLVFGADNKKAAQAAAQSAMACAKTSTGTAHATEEDAAANVNGWAKQGKKSFRVDMSMQRNLATLVGLR